MRPTTQLLTSASYSSQAALRSASLSSSSSLWSSRESCSWKDTIWSLQVCSSCASRKSWEATETLEKLLVPEVPEAPLPHVPVASLSCSFCSYWASTSPAGPAWTCRVPSAHWGWSASQSVAGPPPGWPETAWSPDGHRSSPPWCPGGGNQRSLTKSNAFIHICMQFSFFSLPLFESFSPGSFQMKPLLEDWFTVGSKTVA